MVRKGKEKGGVEIYIGKRVRIVKRKEREYCKIEKKRVQEREVQV